MERSKSKSQAGSGPEVHEKMILKWRMASFKSA